MLEIIQKSKQELQEQYEQNELVINKYNKYIRILNANTFENKLQFFLGTSVYIYSVPLFVMLILKMPSVFGLSPFVSFPLVSISSTLITSSILSYNAFKKLKLKLNKVSGAKTQEEILLEKTKYEIEVEKLTNKNRAIEKAVESLSKEESMINNLNGNYEVMEKQMPRLEIIRGIDDIDKTINYKEEDINLLTTQNYLINRFYNVRSRINGFYDHSVPSMMTSILTLASLSLPMALVGAYNDFTLYHPSINPVNFVLASILTPLILSITGSTLYIKNLSSKEKKVFREINSSLNENAISEKEQTDELKIEKKLNSKITELSKTILEEVRTKRMLESNETKSEEIEKTVNESFIVRNMPNLEDTFDENHREVEGSTLVKRGPKNN